MPVYLHLIINAAAHFIMYRINRNCSAVLQIYVFKIKVLPHITISFYYKINELMLDYIPSNIPQIIPKKSFV